MDDATRILDAGTEEYPLDASMAAAAESCPHCSTGIAAGNMFCPVCGYQRNTWAGSSAAPASSVTASAAADRGPALFELVAADGSSHPLPLGESVLGRGEVDIQIADGYLSRRHASFNALPGKLTLMDLGSANGSFVGDLRLDREVAHDIVDGQAITLGKLAFSIREMASADDATRIAAPELDAALAEVGNPEVAEHAEPEIERISSGWYLEHASEGDLIVPLGALTLGRSASRADVPISGDGYISGLHGRLDASADSLSFTDLGSTNGSLLNGDSIAPNEPVTLSEGDDLTLGRTVFVVRHAQPGDAAADALVEPAEEG